MKHLTFYKYEWLMLIRDRWIAVLSVVLLAAFLYAAYNGRVKVTERQPAVEKALEEQRKSDAAYISLIDSVSRGLKPGLPDWQNPQRLNVIGQRAARVCAYPAPPLALVSTGQSDLFTHLVKPRLYGEAVILGFSELSNPVRLLFGNFDLAFVCVYLLPLLALAFSYNILSSEKESGTLRLALVQPLAGISWLIHKLLVRFVVFAVLFTLAFIVSLAYAGIPLAAHIGSVLKLLLACWLYVLFWFSLSFWVNIRGKSSGNNAVVLISLWVVVVLLLPAGINQLVNNIYPVPSRVSMLTELRKAEADAQKKSDKILAGYYRDHPELAPADTSKESLYPFWLSYFASQEEIRKAVEPVLSEYDAKLEAQQQTVDRLRFLSPALLLQNIFNETAGSSSRHYAAYRKEVIDFAKSWRDFFVPRMFRNELMRIEWFNQLPQFEFNSDKVEQQFGADISGLVFMALGVFVLGWAVHGNRAPELALTA